MTEKPPDEPRPQKPLSARDVARAVLHRVEGGSWATPTLDGELQRSGLDERDRRLVSELVYGVLRNRTRIDHALMAHADLKKTPPKVRTALRIAAYQLLFLDRVPAYAVVDDAVAAAHAQGGAKLGGFANAVLRKLATGEPSLPTVDTTLPIEKQLEPLMQQLEVTASTPRWILDELLASIKPAKGSPEAAREDAVPRRNARLAMLAAAFNEQPPLIARANQRLITRDALATELAARGATATPVDASSALANASDHASHPGEASTDAIAHAPSALRLDGIGDPSIDPGFLAGRWTVQDAGAQLVAQIAAPRAGIKILDACAGVGGKSTHLAELADDRATIHAADQSKTKLGLLAESAQRLGLTSIQTFACDLTDPAAPLATDYDLIVLDAPCSGLGVLRRHPDAKWRLLPDAVARLAGIQRQLLDAVVQRLAPGGTLIYAVCTFTRAEGPDQIAAFAARSGLRVTSVHRTWPPDADAFYIAKLTR